MLLQQIKAQQLQARKDRHTVKARLLTTLIGEAEAVGKNDGNRETTDQEVIALVKKFIKNIDLTIEAGAAQDELLIEKHILNSFLPRQLTDDEIRIEILRIVSVRGLDGTPRNIGPVMKELREKHEGKVDGKRASTIAKELLDARE